MILESLSFTNTLYAFDFDGTLSKLEESPEDARMTEKTETLLRELNDLAPIAIISGRSIADLRTRIGFKPRYLIGNHGLEGGEKTEHALNSAAETCKQWLAQLKQQPFLSGVSIEGKTYTVSIHYRNSRGRNLARKQIRDAVKQLTPMPRTLMGKFVFNLIPTDAPHKGIAILDLMKLCGARNAFYIGDDYTDEDVFTVKYTEGQLMKVRVGLRRSSLANYYISRQSDVDTLLETLLRFHRK